MAAIRGRYNKSTELVLVSLFRTAKITGWRRHGRLPGTPDFIFPNQKLAIFVDGCFWHGCAKCDLQSRTNAHFWKEKIATNKERDKKVKIELSKKGWQVFRVWEHDIKHNPTRVLKRIEKFI